MAQYSTYDIDGSAQRPREAGDPPPQLFMREAQYGDNQMLE
jgi:hypothetical protein